MISIKIDVMKIDKARLFAGKNGAKYLDVLLIESPNNEYGNDYVAVQEVSKEERNAGKRGAILGNARVLVKKNPAQEESSHSEESGYSEAREDCPI